MIPKAFATSHTYKIRVTGYVDFGHLDGGDSIPKGTTACLINVDSNGNRDLLKDGTLKDACYSVKSNGFYGPYATVNTGQDYNIYVSINLSNSAAEMRKHHDIIHVDVAKNVKFRITNSDTMYAHNFTYAQTRETNNNIQAYLWLNEGHSYVNSKFSKNLIQVVAETSVDERANYGNRHISIYYDKYLDDKYTVLHEYGHHVFNSIYESGSLVLNCPVPHYISIESDLGCAYNEGFATVLPFLVGDTAIMKVYWDLWPLYYDIENIESIETFFVNVTRKFNAGHLVEGNVAGMLWDIADSNDDFRSYNAYDLIDDRISDAFDVFENSQPTDHVDFARMWNGYIPHDTYDEAQESLDPIFILNNMGNSILGSPPDADEKEIFYDRMDTLAGWERTARTWMNKGSFALASNHPYDTCTPSCSLTLDETVDLTGYSDVQLEFRYIDREIVPHGERLFYTKPYGTHNTGSLKAYAHDGAEWHSLATMDSKTYWTSKTIKIPDDLLVEDFSLRFDFKHDYNARNTLTVYLSDVQLRGVLKSATVDDDDDGRSIARIVERSIDLFWDRLGSLWTTTSAPNQYGVSEQVLQASACGSGCELTTMSGVNLTEYQNASLNFWYYLSGRIDAYQNEGLRVDVSGSPDSWRQVAFFDDVNTDAFEWHEMNMNLDEYSSSEDFNVRLVAISSKSDEIIRINDVNVTGAVSVRISASNATIFEDSADTFENWDRSGGNWEVASRGADDGGTFHASNCDNECTLVLRDGLDMTPYENARLGFSYRMVAIDGSEGLKVEVGDGDGVWHQVARYTEIHDNDEGRYGVIWSADDIDLGDHVSSESLTLRFTAVNNKHNEHVYLDGIRVYGDFKTGPEATVPEISSSNPGGTHARAEDLITVALNVSESASNATAIILGRNATVLMHGGAINATQTVTATDANGPVSFAVTAENGNLLATQDDLASPNVIVDTTSPVITLTGNNPEILPRGSFYFERGYSAHDADNPLYVGNATSNATLLDTSKLGRQTVLYTAGPDQAGNAPESKTRTVIVFSPTPYGILSFVISSDGKNPAYAKAGDEIFIRLQADRHILGADVTVLGRTPVPAISNNTLTANFSVHENDENGNPALGIVLEDVLSGLGISELNLTGSNVYIDTAGPNLTLNGNQSVRVEYGYEYNDPGALLSDNDPSYSGTAYSNATVLNTSVPGTYLIEYGAPGDAAGNKATNATRTVRVLEAPHSEPRVEIRSDNPNAGRAKTDDTVTVTLLTDRQIANTTASILGKNADISYNGTSVAASIAVQRNDTNGHAVFEIIAYDEAGNRIAMTEFNLSSANVFVDTQPPTIHLTGMQGIAISRGTAFVEPGTEARDNDPAYAGTVTSNASLMDTSEIGVYKIEYSAPADLAGNSADPRVRIVTVDASSITNPVAVSAVTDGSDGFTTLDAVIDIDIVDYGSKTYALSTAFFDHGVQIMDITDPRHPVATSSARYGAEFPQLSWAHYVKTVGIDDGQYALVTSFNNGIQIIDITDPANPEPAASIREGIGGFTKIDRPYGLDIARIGSDTYAVIASLGYYDFGARQRYDSGVQIIDITDPQNPVAAAAIYDNSTGSPSEYTELLGASDVDIVEIGLRTYAVVASYDDDGIQIIDITDPRNPNAAAAISNGRDGFTALDNPSGIDTVAINGGTYAVVTTWSSRGTQIINITDPQNPTAAAVITAGRHSLPTLNAQKGVEIITVGSNVYAVMTSMYYNGIQIADITDPTRPKTVSFARDGVNGFTELYGARGIDTVQSGSFIYALVAGQHDDGIQIVSLGNNTDSNNAVTYGSQTPQSAPPQRNLPPPDMPLRGLHAYSDNADPLGARSGDVITVKWFSHTPLSNASATILDRIANVSVSGNVVTAIVAVLPEDSGHAAFSISALDQMGNPEYRTHLDLESANVFVDNQAPVLTLHGLSDIAIAFGTPYNDKGAGLSDNDPAYDGTVVSGAAVNIFVPGVYVIEYTAPADAAGNAPASVMRTVTVLDVQDPAE